MAFHAAGGEGGARGGEQGKEVLPLGRGMEGVQLLVLDPSGGLAAIGEVGEIAVRSPHLALGYAEDDELTARRFAANPFLPPGEAATAGDRIYRTGDLGRYDRTGEVRFLGRADQQVKIRGFRIELGEVVAHLEAAPGVEDAAVLPRSDGPLGQRLCAYVVTAAGAGTGSGGEGEGQSEGTLDALRGHLRGRLPAYMVPATFVFLDRLPLTPNGKLDRRALLALDDQVRAATGGGKGETATTETERKLATIVQEVLGIERVGVDENFFDLGANSLLLIQVHGRLEEVFGRELAVVELFNHPTLRLLARHLDAGSAAETETAEPGPPRRGAGSRAAADAVSDAASESASDAETQEAARRERLRQGRDRLRRRRR